jgi:hypothetical protein
LEQDPASRAWRRLQPFEVSSKVTDKLVLRWLELNRSNSALCLDVSCVALFTDSVEVVEAVLLWTETEKNNIYVWMVLSHLLRGSSKAHHALRPRISQFVRAWVKEHTNDEYCGRVFADLITVVKLAEDIRDGKVWYQQHQSFDLAWCVLTGLLRAQQKADPYVVEQAKRVLRNLSPEERAPVLVGALVEAHPDAETIAFAKNICMKSNLAWLIAILLPIAPDSDLLAKANEVLPELRGSEIEDDLILALLQTDPTNTSVLKAAKRWMRKNGGHASAASIQSLLTASQAKTGSSNPAG